MITLKIFVQTKVEIFEKEKMNKEKDPRLYRLKAKKKNPTFFREINKIHSSNQQNDKHIQQKM